MFLQLQWSQGVSKLEIWYTPAHPSDRKASRVVSLLMILFSSWEVPTPSSSPVIEEYDITVYNFAFVGGSLRK